MKRTIIYMIIVVCWGCTCCTGASLTNGGRMEYGKWTLAFDGKTKTIDYSYDGEIILNDVQVKAKFDDKSISSLDYPKVTFEKGEHSDIFGSGEFFTIVWSGVKAQPDIRQVYYFYTDRDYFLTEVFLESESKISTNYIAPIYTETRSGFLPEDDSNRGLRVPFDNDNFVAYLSSPLDKDILSFEVTSIFNGRSRRGIVVGSVEHDTWKTGVRFSGEDGRYIAGLECFSGVIDQETRDIANPKKSGQVSIAAHGSIHGTSLKSSLVMFGVFDDWRRGMEAFGDANAVVAPPRKWNTGTPFGWNSWGAMASRVNYKGAVDVSDFIKKELQPRSFENDGVTYIGLDSFWDNFSNEELRLFVEHCHANGQKAGIYWCPFSDWHGNPEAFVEGTNEKYKYKDIYLYSNGQPRKIESLAVDPTHPGTKQRMDLYFNRFKELGYSYVKLDFINNGTLEADSFYNPEVTTGVQAYNEGMKYLTDLCGDDMFLALSIAPIFPSQWGTSRRISCDAWGAMTENPTGTTGYMLNSLSFGWWLDRVYPFNDADHILLYQPREADDYGDGANRARITSAVITGIYMLGDNFSQTGRIPGSPEARAKALKVATNSAINDIARLGRSFYPVEGYIAAGEAKAEPFYMMETDECTYLAVFNFNKTTTSEGTISLERLGLKGEKSDGMELWTSSEVRTEDGSISYSVPPQDVRVYKLNK